jgi:hypothetical protein
MVIDIVSHYRIGMFVVWIMLSGLVFYELKSRIWKAAIERTNSSTYDNPSLVLNNMKAAQAMAQFEAKIDPLEVLDNSMFGQMYNQLRMVLLLFLTLLSSNFLLFTRDVASVRM